MLGPLRAPRWFATLALLPALVGCATNSMERHVAPLYTALSTAGGGKEIEALGGIVRVRYSRPDSDWSQWAIRPAVIQDKTVDGELLTRFLTPFGTAKDRKDETFFQLVPITRYDERKHGEQDSEWTLITLPFIYWSKRADGRILRAWFPFGGIMEEFLSFDRIEFVLFPLWLRTERAGRVTHYVLWPIFAFTSGTGGPSGRVWPLFGRSHFEGRYDRWFFLWPIFAYHRNNLASPPERHETQWMVFPLVGRTSRASFSATSLVWPFFGWSSDPEKGSWSWDGPWPFVRYMRAPADDLSRSRVWPFWSHYHGDGLDSTWYLYPIVNFRHEVYSKGEKDSVYVIPFWQDWKRVDDDAGRFHFQKLWPLYRYESREDVEKRYAFPALNPLYRTPEIDEMYAWMWELYTREVDHDFVHERSWLGLWRREKDALEDRRSLAFVWARRGYGVGADKVRETSLLFGLLRWRSSSRGFELLSPAFPGPGWPIERAGASLDSVDRPADPPDPWLEPVDASGSLDLDASPRR